MGVLAIMFNVLSYLGIGMAIDLIWLWFTMKKRREHYLGEDDVSLLIAFLFGWPLSLPAALIIMIPYIMKNVMEKVAKSMYNESHKRR